jgi:hypothetical protein
MQAARASVNHPGRTQSRPEARGKHALSAPDRPTLPLISAAAAAAAAAAARQQVCRSRLQAVCAWRHRV